MPFRLSISKWQADVLPEQKKALRDILTNMAEMKQRGSYSQFLPLDYSNPQNQAFVGQVLYTIWERCHEEHLPLLNFLVGRADMSFLPSPHKGVGKGYIETFGDLTNFDRYCDLQAQLAESMLQSGAVVIGP